MGRKSPFFYCQALFPKISGNDVPTWILSAWRGTSKDCYHRQTKFAKVKLLHVSVSHSVHGGVPGPRGVVCSRRVPGPGGVRDPRGVCLVPGWGVPGPGVGGAWSRGGGCLVPGWGVPGPGGVWSRREGAWLGGVAGGDPPGRLLLRAVRILLECILHFQCTSRNNYQLILFHFHCSAVACKCAIYKTP